MKYQFIAKHQHKYPVGRICEFWSQPERLLCLEKAQTQPARHQINRH